QRTRVETVGKVRCGQCHFGIAVRVSGVRRSDLRQTVSTHQCGHVLSVVERVEGRNKFAALHERVAEAGLLGKHLAGSLTCYRSQVGDNLAVLRQTAEGQLIEAVDEITLQLKLLRAEKRGRDGESVARRIVIYVGAVV